MAKDRTRNLNLKLHQPASKWTVGMTNNLTILENVYNSLVININTIIDKITGANVNEVVKTKAAYGTATFGMSKYNSTSVISKTDCFYNTFQYEKGFYDGPCRDILCKNGCLFSMADAKQRLNSLQAFVNPILDIVTQDVDDALVSPSITNKVLTELSTIASPDANTLIRVYSGYVDSINNKLFLYQPDTSSFALDQLVLKQIGTNLTLTQAEFDGIDPKPTTGLPSPAVIKDVNNVVTGMPYFLDATKWDINIIVSALMTSVESGTDLSQTLSVGALNLTTNRVSIISSNTQIKPIGLNFMIIGTKKNVA